MTPEEAIIELCDGPLQRLLLPVRQLVAREGAHTFQCFVEAAPVICHPGGQRPSAEDLPKRPKAPPLAPRIN